jgi:hypothetical protein
MPQNMSFASNGVHQVRSLRKIPTRLCLANLCDNGTTLDQFCFDFHAVMKRSKPPQNTTFESNGVDRVRSLQKIPTRLCLANCSIVAPVRPVLHRLSCSNEMVQNTPKHDFWVQWSGSGVFVAKNLTQLCFPNLCINCTSSASFATTFVQKRNGPKRH